MSSDSELPPEQRAASPGDVLPFPQAAAPESPGGAGPVENPIDRANRFRGLLESHGSARAVAAAEGVSASTVLRSLALLAEPPDVQAGVIAGRIVPRSLRGERRPAWKRVIPGDGVTITLAAPRALRLREMAAALRAAAGQLEADGRGRPRGEAA